MKTILIIAVVSLVTLNLGYGQYQMKQLPNYGISTYRTESSSGYKPGLNVFSYVESGRKSLGFGIKLEESQAQVTAVEVFYKYFLTKGPKCARSASCNVQFKPYINYNFSYNTPSEVIINQQSIQEKAELAIFQGKKVSTLEHSLGIGVQVHLFKLLYVDANAGAGPYLGSINKNLEGPGTIGIHKDNWGIAGKWKLGVGVNF
jgi:hypothetical protein